MLPRNSPEDIFFPERSKLNKPGHSLTQNDLEGYRGGKLDDILGDNLWVPCDKGL